MNTSPAHLLRRLGSGVRPDGAAPPAGPAPVESAGFADLLRRARSGELTSKLPVEIDPGAGVTLTDDQLTRVAAAADQAEAAGVRTALLTIDGQRLLLDVHSRRITGPAPADSAVLPGIDGVVDAGDLRRAGPADPAQASPAPAVPARVSPPAGTPAQNASLLDLLARLAGGA